MASERKQQLAYSEQMTAMLDASTTAALVEPAARLGRSDVVTVVLAERRTERRPDLELDLPVTAASVRRLRDDLGSWLVGIGAPRMDAMAIVHSAAELVANRIRACREILGHDVGQDQVPLLVALTLAATLGPAVLKAVPDRQPP